MKGCCKAFTGFGAIIILLIGLGMLGVTIYGYMHPELFLGNTSGRNTVLGVLLGADLFITFGAILGIYGVCKAKGVLICFFQIIVMVFMLVFLGLGIGTVVLPNSFFEGNCTVSANPVINITNLLYTKSDSQFCTSNCPCGLTSDSIAKNYNDNERQFINSFYNVSGTSTDSSQCKDFVEKNDSATAVVAGVIGDLETWLECSNWCDTSAVANSNLIYRFSNVNNGKPTAFCYTKMSETLTKVSHVVGFSAFGASAFLLMLCICNLYLCCSSDNKNKRMRDRFVYNVDGNDGNYGGNNRNNRNQDNYGNYNRM